MLKCISIGRLEDFNNLIICNKIMNKKMNKIFYYNVILYLYICLNSLVASSVIDLSMIETVPHTPAVWQEMSECVSQMEA